MNREEIEKMFDENFCILNDYTYRFKEISPDDVKSFFFDTIFPEVLRGIIPEERKWDGVDYNICIDDIKEKAKEKYNITL